MLFGYMFYEVKFGQNVFVWGVFGGFGVFVVQLIKVVGVNVIGVILDELKCDYVMSFGVKGVINCKDFNCWG